jgi:CubicO group peptidase (beta-lactamase class C family)
MKRRALVATGILVIVVGAFAIPRARHTWSLASAGTAYVAKTLCSGVLMAGLDAQRLLDEELALAADLVDVQIDRISGDVNVSALFGLIDARASRHSGLGCSLWVGDEPPVPLPAIERPGSGDPSGIGAPWRLAPDTPPTPPTGVDTAALQTALEVAFSEQRPEDPSRTRAVVVVHRGWVVAERYAPGIEPTTPLIGWSMTKSVTHALVGIAVADGLLRLHEPIPVPEWSAPGDPRGRITLDQMLRMSSGLAFEEVYDDFTSDAITMLMRTADAGGLAASMPLGHQPDAVWSYSSGTTNIVARALRHVLGEDEAYWRYPYERLYFPIGMTSAVLETDPSGSFVGSSYSYATARDWARFGQLYLNDGVWGKERILPEGWVTYGVTPTPAAPERKYGAHWWLNAGGRFEGVPLDEYRASGYDGQWIMVIPSRDTVIVRLGQTPGDGFDAAAFERAVLDALPTGVTG